VQVKLWNPLRTRAIRERFCGGESLRRGAISSVCTFLCTFNLTADEDDTWRYFLRALQVSGTHRQRGRDLCPRLLDAAALLRVATHVGGAVGGADQAVLVVRRSHACRETRRRHGARRVPVAVPQPTLELQRSGVDDVAGRRRRRTEIDFSRRRVAGTFDHDRWQIKLAVRFVIITGPGLSSRSYAHATWLRYGMV